MPSDTPAERAKNAKLRKSARAKGKLRVAQQAATRRAKSGGSKTAKQGAAILKGKSTFNRAKFGGQLTEKEGVALQKAKAKKRKNTGGAIGLAQKLRRRFPK